MQVLNLALKGAQYFYSGKGHLFFGEDLYWNLAEGTTAKVQGTTAIAVGAVGFWPEIGK